MDIMTVLQRCFFKETELEYYQIFLLIFLYKFYLYVFLACRNRVPLFSSFEHIGYVPVGVIRREMP